MNWTDRVPGTVLPARTWCPKARRVQRKTAQKLVVTQRRVAERLTAMSIRRADS